MPAPWVRYEDEHLLVVEKPAGVNTHRADEHAPDGMVEWVAAQRPGTALSVLHRLDKGTSGLLVFGRSPAANRALAAQFEGRRVDKRYELLCDADRSRPGELRCDAPIGPAGRAAAASTTFVRDATGPGHERWVARPASGRTHQVRIHAADLGLPVLGDDEHSPPGRAAAARLFLHAAGLRLDHPDGRRLDLAAPRPGSFDRVLAGADPASPEVAALAAHEARAVLFDPEETDAYLWIDRHHDGFADVRVERLGDVALVVDSRDRDDGVPPAWLDALDATLDLRAVVHLRRRRGGGGGPAAAVRGTAAPRFEVRELGCRYVVDLAASTTSTGLFLDQRETRRRLLTSDLAGSTVLNAFAHTGSLTVAAALAGAETLTLDLSRRYLDWARENLERNGIDPADHDMVYGDALDWLGRFAKRERTFDLVLLDPPSSSTAGTRRWVVERDLWDLVARGARVTSAGGTLFVSTNLRRMRWPAFLDHLRRGLEAAGRSGDVETRTLPLDHRSGPGDPPYLKAAWISLDR